MGRARQRSHLLTLLGGGLNPGGLLNQNLLTWGAPPANAAIGTAAVAALVNYALGKTFYSITDDDAVNKFEGVAYGTAFAVKAGQRYRCSCLVDATASTSTDGRMMLMYFTTADYLHTRTAILNLAAKTVTTAGVGDITEHSVGITNLGGNIYRVDVEYNIVSDKTAYMIAFGSGETGATATGVAVIAEPTMRRVL